MKLLLLFGGPFLVVVFDETAAAAPYELIVVFDDDDDDGVGDIVVPVVLCGVLFCCSCDELFIGLEFNDGSIAFSSSPLRGHNPTKCVEYCATKESTTTKTLKKRTLSLVHAHTHKTQRIIKESLCVCVCKCA